MSLISAGSISLDSAFKDEETIILLRRVSFVLNQNVPVCYREKMLDSLPLSWWEFGEIPLFSSGYTGQYRMRASA
jgi:hypothetical protein